MTGPTAAELSAMRSIITNNSLPDVCDILSLTRVSDGQGGYTETWGTATASVACRLDPERGQYIGTETTVASRLEPYSTWMLSVPHDTTLTVANRVQVGSATYNVIGVDGGRSWALVKRATLEKVE